MKPSNLKSKIFLDSGDPEETKQALALLGFLDGQTTNPSLIAKNPKTDGQKFSLEGIYDFYKEVIVQIASLIPEGSVSIEVYADSKTSSEEMFEQGKEMFGWIPNAHIKYPTLTTGLKAAEMSVKNGMRVNMTLCFSEEQSAAVYAATMGAKKGEVFISPFVGRLDDIGQNGMDYIKNTVELYKKGDGHVEVLSASIRNMKHFMYSIALGCDILTVPLNILKEWAEMGMPVPDNSYEYKVESLKEIPFKDLDLNQDWQSFNIQHSLTDKGIEKFAADWNKLIST